MTVAAVRIATETRAAIAAAVRGGLMRLRAEPPQKLADWAASHFVLAGESSQQKGAWIAWPFQVAMLDFLSDDRIEEVNVQKSKRVGYSKILTAFIGYTLAHRRRNVAVWQPTDDDRDSFVKTEIDPMIAGVPAVKGARRPGAESDDTLKLKPFRGAVLHTLGGKAARAYRRITVAVALLDEWDAFDQSIEKAGDPRTLAIGRLEGAPYPKFVGGSTPRIKGLSHVESARLAADVDMRYHVPCPICGVEHPLTWGGPKAAAGMKWVRGQPETVRHVCPHCLGSIRQADYLPGGWPLEGTWVCARTGLRYGADRVWRDAHGAETKPPRHVGMHVWSAYSPQRSWESIVREFEHAYSELKAGKSEPMQVFRNETLGETWELSTEAADEHELEARAEEYALGTVPRGALVLVAGVDVQSNRFELVVWGVGRGEEMWVVDYQVLEANPADPRDWDKIDAFLLNRYRQVQHGGQLGIEAAAIDTGGHFTHDVYNFARLRAHRRVYAIAGSSRYGGPVKGPGRKQDVNWRGQMIKAGVTRWEVGTDTAKDLLFGRLRVSTPGPGYVHFPRGLPREFYEQLTAEGRVLQKTSTGEVYRWVKRRLRNEALDCSVYALWAMQMLDLHRYTERMWDRLEAAVQPPPDLFRAAPSDATDGAAAAPPAPPPTTEPSSQAARGSRVAGGFGRAW